MIDARADEALTLTYGWLGEQSSRLANGLAESGVGFGSRVLVGLPQSPEAAVVHLAIARLGAISVPVSVMHGPEALRIRLEQSGAMTGVVEWGEFSWLADVDFRTDAKWILVEGPKRLPTSMSRYEDVLKSASPRHSRAATTDATPATIIFTSGTTGAPKGALHAHRVVQGHAAPLSFLHNRFPQEGDLLWSPADWAWAGGLIDCLFGALHAGIPILAQRARKFDPDETMALISRHGVTNTFLPPTALKMIRASDQIPQQTRLRSIMTGGEAVDASLFDWCEEAFGFTPNTAYGQTEASCIVGGSESLPPCPGSLGMELPGSTIAILDDSSRPVPAGETAEICVRADSPVVFLRYWNDEQSTAEKIRGGWLRTGDLGWRDEDGYLWFSSRRDDVIVSSGYRIGPNEIEMCIETHPDVRAAAVVGIPDPIRGQVVAAFIELHGERAGSPELADQLRQMVRTRLAPYEVPRVLEFVDSLPRTVTGKTQRAALRERKIG